jgi:hypothetical protein
VSGICVIVSLYARPYSPLQPVNFFLAEIVPQESPIRNGRNSSYVDIVDKTCEAQCLLTCLQEPHSATYSESDESQFYTLLRRICSNLKPCMMFHSSGFFLNITNCPSAHPPYPIVNVSSYSLEIQSFCLGSAEPYSPYVFLLLWGKWLFCIQCHPSVFRG